MNVSPVSPPKACSAAPLIIGELLARERCLDSHVDLDKARFLPACEAACSALSVSIGCISALSSSGCSATKRADRQGCLECAGRKLQRRFAQKKWLGDGSNGCAQRGVTSGSGSGLTRQRASSKIACTLQIFLAFCELLSCSRLFVQSLLGSCAGCLRPGLCLRSHASILAEVSVRVVLTSLWRGSQYLGLFRLRSLLLWLYL